MFQILFVFLIKPVWEYIQKSILGNKSVKEAMKTEKKRLMFFFLVTFSFSANVFLIPRIFTLSEDYVVLRKESTKLKETNIGLKALLDNKTCPALPTPKECPEPKASISVPLKKHHSTVVEE